MKKSMLLFLCVWMMSHLSAQSLSPLWEELTAPDFAKAVKQSEGVCIVPMGVIEKHGAHLPLGTDLYFAREVSKMAASSEYCVLFPPYYFGQIFEAKQQPGTIAYSADLLFKMLEETCAEIARNGMKKILFVNGHGGNTNFLQYFCQTRLEKDYGYTCYFYTPALPNTVQQQIQRLRKSKVGGHADEVETSELIAICPELVQLEQAGTQSGEDLNRLSLPEIYTAIWWYAKYPNHYAGDATGATKELGDYVMGEIAKSLAGVIQTIKQDTITPSLEKRFFEESAQPLLTPIYP